MIAALRVVTMHHDAMVETLARTTERCSGLVDVARAAKRLVDRLEMAPGAVEALAPYIEELRKEVVELRKIEAAMGVL